MDDIEAIGEQITNLRAQIEALQAERHRADLDVELAEKDRDYAQAVYDRAGQEVQAVAATGGSGTVVRTSSSQEQAERRAAIRAAEQTFEAARVELEKALAARTTAAQARSDLLGTIRRLEGWIESLQRDRARLEAAATRTDNLLRKVRAKVTAQKERGDIDANRRDRGARDTPERSGGAGQRHADQHGRL